jgi:thioredoxin-related protein
VAQLAQRRGLPVVILVSEPDCGYCIRLKTDVLRPMQRQGRLQERAIVRELRMRTRGKLTDFDGERVRGPVFLGRYQVFAAPTLLFLDPRGGILRDPIVGYNGKERFQPLLEEALTQSRAALSLTAVAQAMPTSP